MMYKIVNQQVAVDPDKHLMKPQKQSHSANTNWYVALHPGNSHSSLELSGTQIFFPNHVPAAIPVR